MRFLVKQSSLKMPIPLGVELKLNTHPIEPINRDKAYDGVNSSRSMGVKIENSLGKR